MTEFIDRAKLEAEAASVIEPLNVSPDHRRVLTKLFMAGAAAYAALLDAETTEEHWVRRKVKGDNYSGQEVLSRRVTPWLPSEGGEKP